MNSRSPFVMGLVLATLVAGCGKKKDAAPVIQTSPVERQDIVIDVEATGVVEPINVVEVKSKASGQITRMPVETGTHVRPNDLLVQLDTRDVRNQYNQTLSGLRAAEARLDVASTQKKRADELHAQRIITAQEYENASLEYANAQAAVVRARTDLDLAQQRLEDATVRAPVAGTIIEKTVSLGQVIASATGTFGGGTTLLKMADLSQVRVRALVNETDIGNVQPGQTASVTVDAYPDRTFRGTVEKIEPQAVVQQSVTMFPVLVTLDNREGFLKPGMNGEVSLLVDRRMNVLAVPNDAVRNVREAAQTAQLLGLDADSVRAQLQAQRGGGGGAGRAPGSGGGGVGAAPGGSDGGNARPIGPAGPAGPTQARTAVATGEVDRAGGQPASVRPAGGRRTGQRRAPADGTGTQLEMRQAPEGGGSGPRPRPGLVFVRDSATGWSPRMVMLGVSNYDHTEVLGGVREGEQVALLSAAALQLRRQEMNDRMRGMGGVPGMQRQGSSGATGGQRGGR